MNTSEKNVSSMQQTSRKSNQNIQVYVRARPLNIRERAIRSVEVVEVVSPKEVVVRHTLESKLTKKFTFDRSFGQDSKQVEVYAAVVAPLIEEVISGYNCTVFAYGQTGTGKTHTMVGNECVELKSSWEDDSDIGIIPRALCHLFDELRMLKLEFSMRISYLELYNEELCDLLSSDDSTKIRIYDDSTKKGSVIIQGLEEIPVHSKDDVYKLLEKGKERRKTASTLMNAQSSRSHTVFSILVHIKENGIDGEEMLKIGKLNLVDLAGSENVSKAGNEKGIRVRETVNINQSLLTLGRVITALVERTPHIPYRESKLTRLLQESLGGRTKTSIIATISPGHKDIEETLSTLEYAHRAKNIQNKPEINQKLTKKTVLKEYTEEIDKLKRDLMAARDKNGIYLAEETYAEMTLKMDSQNRELNEKMLLLKALKDELSSKEKLFNEVSLNLVEKTEELNHIEQNLKKTTGALLETKKVLNDTKKRYKEKKVLLQSHVKTEEILLNQATKIMEVAEIATQDTEALHGTIERRKVVDVKIQTACERFSERMKDNFELMDDNLSQLQSKQQNHSDNFQEELGKCSEVLQSEILENSNKKLKNLHNICENYFETSSSLEDSFKAILKHLNDEQQKILSTQLEEFKEKYQNFKQEVKENVTFLETNNEKQKSSIDYLRDRILKKLTANNLELQQQINENHKRLDAIKQMTLEDIKELQQITMNLNQEQSLIDEEQRALEEFQQNLSQLQQKMSQKMSQLHQKRAECWKTISEKAVNIENSQQTKLTKLDDNSTINQQYLNKTNSDFKTNCVMVENLITPVELCVDQSVAKCSTINTQLENMSREHLAQSQQIADTQSQYLNNFNEETQQYEAKIKRLRLNNTESIKAETENIYSDLEGNSKRLKKHLNLVKCYGNAAQNSLKDYTQLYQKQMKTCCNDLETFRKSELKTYTATGTTPSKKEFSYPRVLAATSPHSNILKRFRQENEMSDLDTTVPIDEESEHECGVISIQDISDAETMLNSTPIDVDAYPLKRSSTESRHSNQLKVPLANNNRSNSLSRHSPNKGSRNNSPRPNSPRFNSPAYLKENQENVE